MWIDLNADVGEGLDAIDAELIPLVSSVNIACGGHAGDPSTMARSVELAQRAGVVIGAHPGYPDREGFGRRPMTMEPDALESEILRQLDALAGVAAEAGAFIRHVKPHGALYNVAAAGPDVAAVVARAVRRHSPRLVLVGLAGSGLLVAGQAAGLGVVAEGFADRAYQPDGSLRPRSLPGAVLEDPAAVAGQAVSIARDGRARAVDGTWVEVDARTICLHSDTRGAVINARNVSAALIALGIEIPVAGGRLRAHTMTSHTDVRVVPFGESALLIELGDVVDARVNAAVQALADRFRDLAPVPGYSSLLVRFDPASTDTADVAELADRLHVAGTEALAGTVELPGPARSHSIAVRYGGVDGPDVADVARRTGLHPDDVVTLHAGTPYRVFMLGFAPGFAYLGLLPPSLRLPRRAEPRPRVPVGSVAIAERQTCIYPHATAGGWHLIGHTDVPVWDPSTDPPALLRQGDEVRFVPR